MRDDAIEELIDRLSSARGVDAAWTEFLARYSPLVMRVIRRHWDQHDRAAEAFLYVCGALSDDGFRRLRRFDPTGPAQFTTWLLAVVSNLCIDWQRKQGGRARPMRRISQLPELEQQVYRCIYERGMSRAQCTEILAPKFPGLDESAVALINAELFRLLTPQQRWRLSARAHASRATADASGSDDDAMTQEGPEELAAEMEEHRRLHDALSKLPSEQRLLLRLRYEQGLTLAEVARLTAQPDLFRANRKVQAALQALTDLLGVERTARLGRKNR